MATPGPGGGGGIGQPRGIGHNLFGVGVVVPPPPQPPIPADNPPFTHPERTPQIAAIAVAATQPDPWQYFGQANGRQPYGPALLPPSVTAVRVDNPPWSMPLTIVVVDDPPLPSLTQKMSPAIPGFSVDPPPPSQDGGPHRVIQDLVNLIADVHGNAGTNNGNGNNGNGNGNGGGQGHKNNPGLPFVWKFLGGAGGQGAQPYAPRKLPPSLLRVPDPPFEHYGRKAWLNSIVAAWQPPDPLPTLPQFVVQAGTTVVVSQSPYSMAWLFPVVGMWQPADPSPTLPRQLAPGIPGQSVDNPPRFVPWQAVPAPPPDPLPTLPRQLSPGIPGQSVDNPPRLVRQPAYPLEQPPLPQALRVVPQAATTAAAQTPFTNVWLLTVLQSWQADAGGPTLPGKLSPAIPGQSVDNPPPFRPWQSVPAPLPDPLPTLPKLLAPGIPGQSVDPPPQTRLWQPDGISWVDPVLLPTLSRPIVPPVQVQVVYVPYDGRPWMWTILQSWQPPDPAPTNLRTLPASITAVQVDNPPFSSRTELPGILLAWQPPDPLPTPSVTINIVQAGATVIPPPTVEEFTVSGPSVESLFGPVSSISWNWDGGTQKRTV